jgi:hypothetical protein
MLEKIQEWYLEAAALHGDNWPNIESYVTRKIATVDRADHAQMLEQIRILLRNKGEILN